MADLGAVGQEGLLTKRTSVGQASPWDNNDAQQGLLTKRSGLYLNLAWDNNAAQEGLLTKRTGLYINEAWSNHGASEGLLTKRSFFEHIEPPPEPPPVPPKVPVVSPFTCPQKIDCDCPELPLENLSSEDVDVPVFCATVTYREDSPPLGQCPTELVCTEFCCSDESQLDAYLCALREAQECVWNQNGTGTCPPPPDPVPNCPPVCPPNPCPPCSPFCPPDCPPPPPFAVVFRNFPQTCSVPCPDGGTFSWTVPDGTVLSNRSQADADHLAHSLACQLARTHRLCLEIDGSTTNCKDDFMSFKVRATGPLTQSPLPSQWFVSGPGIDPNVLGYNSSPAAVFGTNEIEIFGTPTIVIDTYIIVRIQDNNTGTFMERTIPISIVNCAVDWGAVEPDIFSNTRSYWNSSADIPAGNYKISYLNGAWRPGPAPLWVVGDGGGAPPRGYVIVYNNDAASIDFPTSGIYASQADAEAGTAGLSQVITHTGGRIGIYLRDFPYGDNHPGSPNPRFKLETV